MARYFHGIMKTLYRGVLLVRVSGVAMSLLLSLVLLTLFRLPLVYVVQESTSTLDFIIGSLQFEFFMGGSLLISLLILSAAVYRVLLYEKQLRGDAQILLQPVSAVWLYGTRYILLVALISLYGLIVFVSYWLSFLVIADTAVLEFGILATLVSVFSGFMMLSAGLLLFAAPMNALQKGPLLLLLVVLSNLSLSQQSSALSGFLGFFIPSLRPCFSEGVMDILDQANGETIEFSLMPFGLLIALILGSLALAYTSLKHTEILRQGS